MRLRYAKRAAAQIDAALAYVAARSPQGARRLRARIETITELLQGHPLAGRDTSNPLVRRIVVTPYPYLIDYRLTASEVIILRFRHAARAPVS
ncbi:type II toxin-antitoxin system RelE/ParE family toxin [Methylocystis rosea]|uniref:type II toxin-antitoxin system RelE/ParE family toxin n=1 Tax=Methylocystis rosea TaxID=173366 RepID=UPI000361DD23|nr:type II toxin-antitoxin system RelE/ParE family toxin [Methylocystis rosea]